MEEESMSGEQTRNGVEERNDVLRVEKIVNIEKENDVASVEKVLKIARNPVVVSVEKVIKVEEAVDVVKPEKVVTTKKEMDNVSVEKIVEIEEMDEIDVENVVVNLEEPEEAVNTDAVERRNIPELRRFCVERAYFFYGAETMHFCNIDVPPLWEIEEDLLKMASEIIQHYGHKINIETSDLAGFEGNRFNKETHMSPLYESVKEYINDPLCGVPPRMPKINVDERPETTRIHVIMNGVKWVKRPNLKMLVLAALFTYLRPDGYNPSAAWMRVQNRKRRRCRNHKRKLPDNGSWIKKLLIASPAGNLYFKNFIIPDVIVEKVWKLSSAVAEAFGDKITFGSPSKEKADSFVLFRIMETFVDSPHETFTVKAPRSADQSKAIFIMGEGWENVANLHMRVMAAILHKIRKEQKELWASFLDLYDRKEALQGPSPEPGETRKQINSTNVDKFTLAKLGKKENGSEKMVRKETSDEDTSDEETEEEVVYIELTNYKEMEHEGTLYEDEEQEEMEHEKMEHREIGYEHVKQEEMECVVIEHDVQEENENPIEEENYELAEYYKNPSEICRCYEYLEYDYNNASWSDMEIDEMTDQENECYEPIEDQNFENPSFVETYHDANVNEQDDMVYNAASY